MLHLKMIVLMRGIQLNTNFSNLSNPVLTTTQNEKKLHIFDSNSLVSFLYGHIIHDVTCTNEMNVSDQESIENWNENMQ